MPAAVVLGQAYPPIFPSKADVLYHWPRPPATEVGKRSKQAAGALERSPALALALALMREPGPRTRHRSSCVLGRPRDERSLGAPVPEVALLVDDHLVDARLVDLALGLFPESVTGVDSAAERGPVVRVVGRRGRVPEALVRRRAANPSLQPGPVNCDRNASAGRHESRSLQRVGDGRRERRGGHGAKGLAGEPRAVVAETEGGRGVLAASSCVVLEGVDAGVMAARECLLRRSLVDGTVQR